MGDPINDINLTQWRDYSHLRVSSLWIDEKDHAEGKDAFHGRFIRQIPEQLIVRYTRPGELVVDPFLGTGTTLDVCRSMARRFGGIDIQRSLVEAAHAQGFSEALLEVGDSRRPSVWGRLFERAESKWGIEQAALTLLHPPYWKIISFSEEEGDLSRSPTLEGFLQDWKHVVGHAIAYTLPGRYSAVVMGNAYEGGRLIPLVRHTANVMEEIGWIPKAEITKNITGNERGKGKNSNLWRYRALQNGFYLLDTEVITVWQKQP